MPEEAGEQGTIRYIRCPSCGMPNPGTSERCSRCSKPLQAPAEEAPSSAPPAAAEAPQQVACPKCRKTLPAGSRFCGFCGTPLAAVAPAESQPGPASGQVPAPRRVAPAPPARKVAGTASKPAPTPAARPPVPSVKPETLPDRPAAIPSAPSAEATQVLAGVHLPKTELRIVEINSDGSVGKTVLIDEEISIGRGPCDLSYPEDATLATRHARLYKREAKVYLKDFGTPNGTFLKQRQDTQLNPSDVFVLGRQVFRFTMQKPGESSAEPGTVVLSTPPKLQTGPLTAKLELIQLNGEVIKEFNLEKAETTIGRSKGEWSFPDDPYMSGAHARIVTRPGKFVLQDLNSRNGVYHQIRGEVELQDSDEFFLGEQRFRVELKVT